MGLALKRLGLGGRIVGVSRSETIAQALELGVIHEGWGYDELQQALKGADLVFICTPIKRILALIEEVGRLAEPGALVTDVGSTKRRIVAQAQASFSDEIYFVGGHPMAGSEKAGVTAADPFLFQNAIYILVPDEKVPADRYEALVDLLRKVGARVMELQVEAHDQAVAAISHLPQMMATSLVEMVGRLNEGHDHFLPLAAGGFRDLTRIASSPFAMWEDIFATNGDEIRGMIDRYIAVLEDVKGRLEEQSLGADFDFANKIRGAMPRDSKGFIHVLHEVLVLAEDRPGVIAEIGLALGEQGVNINDIEVMKVREGEGGTLRLGFDSADGAERAMGILAAIGYTARRP
jgi:prephenate dehydrogenase